MGVPSGVIEGSSPISVLKPLLAEQKAAAAAAAKALKVSAKSAATKAPAKGKMTPAAKAKLEAQQRKEADDAAEKLATSVQLSQSVSNQKIEEYKIRATVAWTADAGKKIGLQFAKVPDAQRRQIESFLKGLCA
jgi:hypothetical protein